MSRRSQVLSEVSVERDLQERRFPEQRLPDGTSEDNRSLAEEIKRYVKQRARLGVVTWSDVLTEEYREALAEEDPELLRVELIQVAAVAVRWIEDIDRRIV